MLVSFSISNFRSFSSEETLSLVASKRLAGPHVTHEVSIPFSDEKVLRTAVIYGANGAGKSNLFKALRFFRRLALRSRAKNSSLEREPFRFNNKSKETSNFDLRFIAENQHYRYGLKVDDRHIVEEWLVRQTKSGEKTIFERVTDNAGRVVIEAPGLKSAGKKLNALVTVGALANQTFLSTISTNLDTAEYGKEISNVIDWFKRLNLVAPNESFGPLAHKLSSNSSFLKFADNFLNASSTGVSHLKVNKEEISEDELRSLLPSGLASKEISELVDHDDGRGLVRLRDGKELLIERSASNHFYRISIITARKDENGDAIPLELTEESDGTLRLLNLLPALHHLQSNKGVFFIDEIDRSMHPMLSMKFVEFFLNSCASYSSQLIVTTHECNLLDLNLLRRDEIWFTEKDSGGATRLYSMTDFKVRNDLEIRKGYLQGRFGAIPFLSNLDKLMEKEV